MFALSENLEHIIIILFMLEEPVFPEPTTLLHLIERLLPEPLPFATTFLRMHVPMEPELALIMQWGLQI